MLAPNKVLTIYCHVLGCPMPLSVAQPCLACKVCRNPVEVVNRESLEVVDQNLLILVVRGLTPGKPANFLSGYLLGIC